MRKDEEKAIRGKVEIDPVTVLENAGVDNYRIDYDKKEVYTNFDALEKVAEFMDFKLPDGCIGFKKGGWWWLLVE